MSKKRWWVFVLLILTVAAIRLVVQGWQPVVVNDRPTLSVRLDYRFDGVDYRELDEQGKPFFRLTTPHLTHDPEQDLAIAQTPNILVKQAERDWYISAEEGFLQRDSNAVQLLGHVLIASEDAIPPMRMESEELRYYAQNRDIAADGDVRLIRDRAEATGRGLEGNLTSGKYRLLHDVEITIHALDE